MAVCAAKKPRNVLLRHCSAAGKVDMPLSVFFGSPFHQAIVHACVVGHYFKVVVSDVHVSGKERCKSWCESWVVRPMSAWIFEQQSVTVQRFHLQLFMHVLHATIHEHTR